MVDGSSWKQFRFCMVVGKLCFYVWNIVGNRPTVEIFYACQFIEVYTSDSGGSDFVVIAVVGVVFVVVSVVEAVLEAVADVGVVLVVVSIV